MSFGIKIKTSNDVTSNLAGILLPYLRSVWIYDNIHKRILPIPSDGNDNNSRRFELTKIILSNSKPKYNLNMLKYSTIGRIYALISTATISYIRGGYPSEDNHFLQSLGYGIILTPTVFCIVRLLIQKAIGMEKLLMIGIMRWMSKDKYINYEVRNIQCY